ncbi:MAG: ABC transporter substrate-binding protein [Planctomycetes bacterium]|nr:ABC transporter substrate-binding protein [Planctomycetota bacterium]
MITAPLLVLLLAYLLVPASGQPVPVPVPAQPAAAAKTLRLPLAASNVSLDPHMTPGSNSLPMIADVYEGLTQWVPGEPSALAPCLAKDWPKISKDGLTYTFTLRAEVKFHNASCFEEGKGRTLKASDVVASFKRLAACSAEPVNWFWLVKGWIAGLDEYADACQTNGGFAGHDDTEVEGLSAPDDATFVLKLKRPCAAMLAILAHPALSVVAEEGLNNFGSMLATREAGTGPYRLQAVTAKRLYVMKRVEDYWGDKPYFDRITYATPRTMQSVLVGEWARIALGGSEYARYSSGGKIAESLKNSNLELVEPDDEGITFLAFNMEDPLFGARDADGRGLRKAISLAINRDEIIEATFQSKVFARPAAQLLPAGCEYAEVSSHAEWCECDLKKAKEALDATKFKGGKDPATGNPLKLKFVCGTDDEGVVECIARGLQSLGIELEAEQMEVKELYAAMDGGQGQLFAYGWNLDFPIAQNFLQLFDSRNVGSTADNRNCARYNVKEFDEAYAALQQLAMRPENAAKRKELTKKLCDLIREDRAVMPLYVRKSPMLRNTLLDWPKLSQSAFDEARFIKAKQ